MATTPNIIDTLFTSWCIQNKERIIDLCIQAFEVTSLDKILEIVALDVQTKTEILNKSYSKLFNFKTEIREPHYKMIEHLLKLGVGVNGNDSVYPLTVATKANNYRLVALLCGYGADCNKTDTVFEWDLPPLSIAAKEGRYDIIELLLSHGASVDDCSFHSAIEKALINDHIECARLLNRHGARVNVGYLIELVMDRQKFKLFDFLVENYREETYEYIINHKQDVFLGAVKHTNAAFVNAIFDIGYWLVGERPSWSSFLDHARNGEIARCLVNKGADVKEITETLSGKFSVPYKILSRSDMKPSDKEEVIKVLLQNGASPDGTGDVSPLMLAALSTENITLLKLLIQYGADVNAVDMEGDSVLTYCMKRNNSSNAVFLIRNTQTKEFLDMPNKYGVTPLMHAVRFGDINIVRELLVHISNLDSVDNDGNNALLHAIDILQDNDDKTLLIVKALIKAACNVNHQNEEGISPLILATNRYKPSVIKMLLKAGARVNETSKVDTRKTALSYFSPPSEVTDKEFKMCLSYFIERGACLSYLHPTTFHRILLLNDADLIYRIFTSGSGPMCMNSCNYFSLVLSNKPYFKATPLNTALADGNVGLARGIINNIFLTVSDVYTLPYNHIFRRYLDARKYKQCLNILNEVSRQPLSLYQLAFVTVSTMLGTQPGRTERVNVLEIPGIVKDALLFKDSCAFTLTKNQTSLLPAVLPDRVNYIKLNTSCKYCSLWQKLRVERNNLGYICNGSCECPRHGSTFLDGCEYWD